ncbi:SMODS domain-containing nucleotidyltransferase [Streptomyces goshikiensis]|uniref:SMODS domain-containing nucleotidyltransferase n=1 Tax=Streptomyces goshikiensis TaxID=1942 RepID=UPI0036A962A5
MTEIWEAINQYLDERAPKDWHKAEVRKYRQRIYDILYSEFRLMSFFQSGSFQHGTAIMPYSDVDYISRFHFEDKPNSSNTILNKVRDTLKRELWEASSVYVARPTVTLQFTGLISSYEITPAYLLRGSCDDDRVVAIPAPGGEWRESAPQAHNKFVAEMDGKHKGGVREIARLFKAWKYEQAVPVSSFYLEMRCAEYGKNNDTIWSLGALRSIAAKLIDSDLAAMNDPTGLVSRISACSGESNRVASMSKLRALKKNLETVITAWNAGSAHRWEMNQALQAIWGTQFPYCDTDS